MNVAGLWTGIGVGCVIQAYFYIHLCTFTAEWDQIADEAFKRIQAEGMNSFENSYMSIEKQKTVNNDEEELDGNTPEKYEVKAFDWRISQWYSSIDKLKILFNTMKFT